MLHEGSAVPAQAACQVGVPQEEDDAVGEGIEVPARAKESGLPLLDDLGDAARVRCDDRGPGGEGLEAARREAFDEGREQQYGRLAQELGDALVVHLAEEPDV